MGEFDFLIGIESTQSNGDAQDLTSQTDLSISVSAEGQAEGFATAELLTVFPNFDVRQFLPKTIVPSVVSNTMTTSIPSRKLLLLNL